ncbi:MAG: VWA domain-containing protein [Armatimonadetes bacterium]|nr:VWA domain-containing protein [Armatimonadota bacterium]
MLSHLTTFARALRSAGMPVSPAELLVAAEAVRAAGIGEREPFRLALRASVVKSAEHLPVFDRLFEAHFRVAWPSNDEERRDRKRRQQPGGDRGHRTGGRGEGQGRRPREEPEQHDHARSLRELRETARREQHLATRRALAEAEQRRRVALRRQPLDQRLAPDEVQRLDRECEALGRVLRTRYGRRFRRAAHGRVDIRATIAAGARTCGVPFKLLRRRPRITKPRLLVLCDVSGSVHRTARFLLRLLHEVQRLFDSTTGFVFVDRPVPAAPLFRFADFDDALDHLAELPGLDLHALSDFGNAFERLLAEDAELLTRRTSVLVLGDARCNRFDPQAWAFEELARRTARVVWLNPERRESWYTHDSRLRDYEPWIDRLLPAETLEDLAAGIERVCREAVSRR